MKAIGEVLKNTDIKEKFRGFVRPNTTPTPDDLFDIFLTQLTHAELKVLLYIIRRTYGFKKDDDRISLKQIAGGIMTKKGNQLDKGAGITKRGAIKALQALEEKGLISVSRTHGPDGNNQINVYRLRFRE